MRFKSWLNEVRQRHFDFMKTPVVSPEKAKEMGLFGPVYHGTNAENQRSIEDTGFNVFVGQARTGQVSNGYATSNYHGNVPAPVHHLGFGVYFTTNKNIAKVYNGNTTKGLVDYFVHAPRMETINFGAPNTMMKWWRSNGYDMKPVQDFAGPGVEEERLQATIRMTNVLKSKFDAVYFKGKGLKRLLDGDQICVFDALNIYRVDKSLGQPTETDGGAGIKVGDRFVIKGTKRATAVVTNIRLAPPNAQSAWVGVLGPFKHYLYISQFKDPNNEMTSVYANALRNNVMPLAKERAKNSGNSLEQEVENTVNYYLTQSIKMNLPSTLVGRVLQKGERA